MIIYIQPMYSKAELNGDSCYVIYSAMVRAMLRVRPDWHFVVSFPSKDTGFKYDDDGTFRLPNITRVPMKVTTRKMGNAVHYDANWYDAFFRAYGFDGIWCHLVEIAANLRSAGEGTYDLQGRPVVVAQHNYVIHDSLPCPFDPLANVAFMQIAGSLGADWNVFNSEHCRNMMHETAGKFLVPHVIKEKITDRHDVIPLGTVEESLTYRESGNKVPVFIYNHRLQSYKNYETTFAVLKQLWDEGLRFKVIFTNTTTEKMSRISSLPFVEVRLCATREEYLKTIQQGDLNVTNSQHETFCISAAECMALGMPLIAPNGVTFPQITGASAGNGYPFLFTNEAEQLDMLRRLITNESLRRKWGKVVSDHVCREYKQNVWATRTAELFERFQKPLNTADDTLDFVKGELQRRSGCTVKEFQNFITGKKVGDRIPLGHQSCTLTKILKLVRHCGGRVVFRGGQQIVLAK